jgi:IS605 OrfB family transposase
MKRTVSLKLAATPEQAQALSGLQTEFASACNAVVPFARDHRCWNRVALHHLAYYKIREVSPLGSQMVCNAIKAVADSYKVLKLRKVDEVPVIAFKPSGSVHLDARTFSLEGDTVSLSTLEGRIKVQLALGDFQTAYLAAGKPKEAELICKGRRWFLNLVLDLPDAAPIEGGGILGVDLGENNLAGTSTGKFFGGGKLRHHRDRYLALRRRLQANGSQSARQLLRKVSGREARHVKHVNHEVSKAVVAEAVNSGASTVVMEDLTNIRKWIKAKLRERTRLHRWAWAELQGFVGYKAEAAGLGVVYVDPAYSSQTCSVCGCLGRRVKHRFSCSHCGLLAHSDCNSSRNLAKIAPLFSDARAPVTAPNVDA